jgi:hypothetical protein
MEETTITVSYTVTLKPEPNVTAEDKDIQITQMIKDQAASIARQYDWGVAVSGEATSAITGNFVLSETKPDYVPPEES